MPKWEICANFSCEQRMRSLTNGLPIETIDFFIFGKSGNMAIDKKTKKKIEVARKKIEKLRVILACAKEQTDEPDEVEKIQSEIAAKEAEIAAWKNS